jgi:hypothetical protein
VGHISGFHIIPGNPAVPVRNCPKYWHCFVKHKFPKIMSSCLKVLSGFCSLNQSLDSQRTSVKKHKDALSVKNYAQCNTGLYLLIKWEVNCKVMKVP